MKGRWLALSVGVALLGGTATLLWAADDLPAPGRPAKPTAAEQQLAGMLKEREKTATSLFESTQSLYDSNRTTLSDYLDALHKMSEAEMALATSPQEALERMKSNVSRFQELEKKVQTRLKAENTPTTARELARAKYERQSAEINLALFRLQAKI